MQKKSWSFVVPALAGPVAVTRWGHYGMPVVLFASAGADALEPERQQLIQAVADLIEAGRIKVYAVEGTAMRTVLAGNATAAQRGEALHAFDTWVAGTLVSQVREDCQSDSLELLAAGCAYGAASAMQALLREPRAFRGAIGLSGTYDLLPWVDQGPHGAQVSPLQARALVPGRTALLAHSLGDYEDLEGNRRMAEHLRECGATVRKEVGRAGLHFGFAAWRELLPRSLMPWL